MPPKVKTTTGGTMRIVGPCIVGFADLPNDGSVLDLFTPNVGDVIYDIFADPEAGTPWAGASLATTPLIGQGVGVNGPYWYGGISLSDFANSQVMAAGALSSAGLQRSVGSVVVHTPAPVQIMMAGANPGDGSPIGATAGEVHLYFVVGTPAAP